MKRISLLQCDTAELDQGAFGFKRKRLGAAVGAQKVGASWFEIPPGKKAFPFHYHLANEEAVYVLEGQGVLRNGEDEEQLLNPGDYVWFPPGAPAHQILNRGEVPLRYLAISSLFEPEVAVYPDSKKIGFIARSFGMASVHKEDTAVDYYEDEK
jgi:uncharacterized cupin superfamily protein